MKLNLLFVLLFITNFLFAQSPYEFNAKKEAIYLGVGTGMMTASYIVDRNFIILGEEQIFALDRSTVNRFDRGAIGNFSSSAKSTSDIFFFGTIGFSGLWLTHKRTRKDFGKIMLLYVETLSIVGGTTALTKRVTRRTRPFVYNPTAPFSEKITKNARRSFFSGHASVTAANSIFAAKVFSDYFPDSKWKPLVWSVAIAIPTTTSFLRVKAGRHYPTDVITGSLVGGLVAFFVPHLHRNKDLNSLTVVPIPSGFLLTKTF